MTRYYPGFLAAFLIDPAADRHRLALPERRVGEVRLDAAAARRPFSAEIYLRNANGPLAPYFREHAAGRGRPRRPRPDQAQGSWQADVERIAGHFGFTDAQRSRGVEAARRGRAMGRPLVQRPAELGEAEEVPPRAGRDRSHRDERPGDVVRDANGPGKAGGPSTPTASALIGPLNERNKDLRDAVAKIATSEQIQAAGPRCSRGSRSQPTPGTDRDAISRPTPPGPGRSSTGSTSPRPTA